MLPSEDFRECLVKDLSSIRDTIKDHEHLIQLEKEIQRCILERLWVLAQRYSILIKEVPTKLHIPFEAIHQPEDEIKGEFLAKLCTLEGSNSKLAESLSNLRNNFNELTRCLDKVDAEQLSSMDKETTIQLPYATCIETLEDLIKYFTRHQSQIDCYAMLLKPDSVPSIERYKKLWEPNREFNNYSSKSLATLHLLKKTK